MKSALVKIVVHSVAFKLETHFADDNLVCVQPSPFEDGDALHKFSQCGTRVILLCTLKGGLASRLLHFRHLGIFTMLPCCAGKSKIDDCNRMLISAAD